MSPLLYQLSYTARAAKLTTYDAIVKGTIWHCARNCVRQPSCALRLADRQGDNVIAIEYRARFVPGDSHAHETKLPRREIDMIFEAD